MSAHKWNRGLSTLSRVVYIPSFHFIFHFLFHLIFHYSSFHLIFHYYNPKHIGYKVPLTLNFLTSFKVLVLKAASPWQDLSRSHVLVPNVFRVIIMENQMETTIMENQMETTIMEHQMEITIMENQMETTIMENQVEKNMDNEMEAENM